MRVCNSEATFATVGFLSFGFGALPEGVACLPVVLLLAGVTGGVATPSSAPSSSWGVVLLELREIQKPLSDLLKQSIS